MRRIFNLATSRRSIAFVLCFCVFCWIALNFQELYKNIQYRCLIFVDMQLAELQSINTGVETKASGEEQSFNLKRINVPLSDQDVIIIVSDTGVDTGNPAVRKILWNNPYERPGNGIDDDSNGCVDDIHGCNLISKNGNIADEDGHGTYVAGIIAGTPEQAVKVPLAASRIHLVAVKGSTSFAKETIEYAKWLGWATGWPVVINLSWNQADYELYFWRVPLGWNDELIDKANRAGIILVASAGNNSANYPEFPATHSINYPNVISVGALNANNQRADFSNRLADIGAPGVQIISYNLQRQLAPDNGTSASAPLVAQTVVLLRQLYPRATPAEIKNLLLSGSDQYPTMQKDFKGGRVLNARKTLGQNN